MVPKELIGKTRKTEQYIKRKQLEFIVNSGKVKQFMNQEQYGIVTRIWKNGKVTSFSFRLETTE